MARMREKSKAKRVTIPGMSGVEGRVTIAEGEYRVRVAEVSEEDGQNYPYLKWKFNVTGKVHDGAPLFYNTSLAPQALWNLRGLLEAMQFDIPDDDLEIDPSEFTDLELMVNVEHDTYDGKKQAKIVDFWPVEGTSKAEDDEDEEETKPAKKSRKEKRAEAKARADSDEDGEDEEETKRGRKAKRARDEDEDESPKSRKGKKQSKAMLQQDDLIEMKQDELEDVIEKYEFDLDLSDFPTLRKMRNAVIEAAEAAGVLEE